MKKIFLLIVAFGCMAAQAQTEEIDAISATQGESTDWYRFADYDDVVEVSITAQGIQFPGTPGKTYAIADGAVYTAFGTAPEGKITLTAADFTVTEDGDWTYDNTEKKVKVEIRADYEMPEPSCMTIYYNNDPQVKPINAGTYQVYIDIKGDSRYNDVEGLTDDAWTFTIKAPITFTLTNKTAGQYATICLPQPIASVTNGTLYKISYGNVYEVHFVEETNFAADPAGTPYLVQANADGDIVFTMTDAEPITEPVGVEAANGFVASLQEEMQDIPEGYDHLLVSGGELHSAGPGCKLSKNHAYINVNYVPETEPVVPGAPRRVTLYNAEAQSPTGLGQSAITNHKSAMKVVKNGQFVIIRDNKMYNAQGIKL